MKFDDTAIAFEAKNNRQLQLSNFVFTSMGQPWMVKIGTFLTTLALRLRLPVKGIIKSTLFHQFCGGESIKDCADSITHLNRFNVKTILDYSVEGQEDEKSFDQTKEEALRVAKHAKDDDAIPFCVVKLTGLGSSTIMTKIQSGKTITDEEEARHSKMKARIEEIATLVADTGQRLLIDAEETWYQDVVDDLCVELMLQYNKDRAVIYNTYQLYRHQALPNMKIAFERVTSEGCYFGAKLVRGAYMEQERERAEKKGYPDPIQPNKSATDRDYDEALKFAVDHINKFALCAGTHNEASSALLAELMAEKKIDKGDERIFFAQLLGMSDNISFKLSHEGYNVAKYMPYGPVELVMPYLFRRAEENTSVAGQSGRELMLVRKELKRRKSNR